MEFKPLHSAEDLSSPFNSGGGLGLAVSSAAVLCLIVLPWIYIGLKLIGM